MQDQTSFVWDDVRFFLALHRKRSLHGAAAVLGVDASTVSRRLAAFEARLETALFDRSREGMLPTAAAEHLLVAAEAAESSIGDFAGSVSSFEREVEGSVRITAPPGFVELFLVPQLKTLLELHPRLRIEIDMSQHLLDLTRREADIALRTIKPTAGDLVITHFARSEYRPVATAALAKRLGTLRSFGDARWIGWGPEFAHIPAARWLGTHCKDVETVLRTNSLPAQLAAARSGLGVALLPGRIAQSFDLTDIRLSKKLRAQASFPNEDLWLVGHRALRKVPRVDAVWRFLIGLARVV